MNRCQINDAFTMVGKEFIVFAETTIGTEPAPRNNFKALEVIATQGNIDDDLFELLGDPLDKLAAIAARRPTNASGA